MTLAILFGLLVLASVGAIIWMRIRGRPGPPSTWRHVGKPPEGIDSALEALRPLCRGMEWGGTIEWVSVLWRSPYEPDRLFEGQVLDFPRHRIRLLRHEHAWCTALAHEIDHLRRDSATEPDQAWVTKANAAIRAAIP